MRGASARGAVAARRGRGQDQGPTSASPRERERCRAATAPLTCPHLKLSLPSFQRAQLWGVEMGASCARPSLKAQAEETALKAERVELRSLRTSASSAELGLLGILEERSDATELPQAGSPPFSRCLSGVVRRARLAQLYLPFVLMLADTGLVLAVGTFLIHIGSRPLLVIGTAQLVAVFAQVRSTRWLVNAYVREQRGRPLRARWVVTAREPLASELRAPGGAASATESGGAPPRRGLADALDWLGAFMSCEGRRAWWRGQAHPADHDNDGGWRLIGLGTLPGRLLGPGVGTLVGSVLGALWWDGLMLAHILRLLLLPGSVGPGSVGPAGAARRPADSHAARLATWLWTEPAELQPFLATYHRARVPLCALLQALPNCLLLALLLLAPAELNAPAAAAERAPLGLTSSSALRAQSSHAEASALAAAGSFLDSLSRARALAVEGTPTGLLPACACVSLLLVVLCASSWGAAVGSAHRWRVGGNLPLEEIRLRPGGVMDIRLNFEPRGAALDELVAAIAAGRKGGGGDGGVDGLTGGGSSGGGGNGGAARSRGGVSRSDADGNGGAGSVRAIFIRRERLSTVPRTAAAPHAMPAAEEARAGPVDTARGAFPPAASLARTDGAAPGASRQPSAAAVGARTAEPRTAAGAPAHGSSAASAAAHGNAAALPMATVPASAARIFAALLAADPAVTAVSAGGRGLDEDGATAIALALGQSRSVRSADLRDNAGGAGGGRLGGGMRDGVAAALARALVTNRALTTLNLSRNRLTRTAAELLGAALAHPRCRLRTLDLSHNRLHGGGAEALSRGLAASASLRRLQLGGNQLGDAGALALASALAARAAATAHGGRVDGRAGRTGLQAPAGAGAGELAELLLPENQIGIEGAAALGAALGANCRLALLSLFQNRIGPAGAAGLAAGLEGNAHLLELRLGRNRIGDGGARALASSLRLNHGLSALSLRSNGLTDAAAIAFGAHLKANSGLNCLDLLYNAIGDDGARALCLLLPENEALDELDLGCARGALPVPPARPHAAEPLREACGASACQPQLALPG